MIRRLFVLSVLLFSTLPSSSGAAEGRIPVFASPTVIAVSGKYILTNNLPSNAAGPVITITAPEVDLDLNGMVVDQLANVASPAIGASAMTDLSIRNGTVLGGNFTILAVDIVKVTIEDVKISGASQDGIFLERPRNFVLQRNQIRDVVSEGILVAGLTTAPSTGSILGNVITLAESGIVVEAGRGVSISDNQLDEIGLGAGLGRASGIVLEESVSSLVSGNTVGGTEENGIEFTDCSGFTASGNNITNARGVGIGVFSGLGARLAGNVIVQSQLAGILVDGASVGTMVLNNVATLTSAGPGASVSGVSGHIEGNLLVQNSDFGLILGPSTIPLTPNNNVFRRNTATQNGGAALCVASSIPDFCNNGLGNISNGDNYMPGPI